MTIKCDSKAVKQTLVALEQNNQNVLQKTLQKAGNKLRKQIFTAAYPSILKMQLQTKKDDE